MIKCRDFNACKNSCEECDIIFNKRCDKEFNFEIPERFVRIERRDHIQISWNECPVCRNRIGYKPEVKDYRCERCGKRIMWK